jgi:hypothetical protein
MTETARLSLAVFVFVASSARAKRAKQKVLNLAGLLSGRLVAEKPFGRCYHEEKATLSVESLPYIAS